MFNNKFERLIKLPPRLPESRITQEYCDLAASIQKVLEVSLLNLLKGAKEIAPSPNLCLAGGVALNCVANSVIKASGLFDQMWIQPAAGDAGGSVGAALAFTFNRRQESSINARVVDKKDGVDLMKSSLLGREFGAVEIRDALVKHNIVFEQFSQSNKLIEYVAFSLSQGKSVGWFQGRSEFGPRALGNRSILADPRSPNMQKRLNLQTKFRESFRPFAPSILEEEVSNWFEWKGGSPYMLFVAPVKEEHRLQKIGGATKNLMRERNLTEEVSEIRSNVPAITHVDFSARLQTVSKNQNPMFYQLLREFKKQTGVPMLVNTSFNIRGEPIVDSPADAIKCFLGTDIDILVMENFVSLKGENAKVTMDYRTQYELD